MARKRIIDPEFWSDEEIGSWSYEARLFYIGIWNFADDEGRLKAHSLLLRAQIFPYDHKIDIEKLKTEISNKVQWYEAEGSKYGFVRNFLRHQRIDRPVLSKLPPPQEVIEDSTNTHRGLIEDSSSPQRGVLPNIIEVNIREDKGARPPKSAKVKHLTFVYLLPEEYEKLIARFGKDAADQKIFTLNNYIGSKGDKYKSHYHTILNWAYKDIKSIAEA